MKNGLHEAYQVLLGKVWKTVINYECVSTRTVKLRLKILIYTIRFIGIYAPLEEKNRETRGFYDNLKVAVEKNYKSNYHILAGHFNATDGAQLVDKYTGTEGEKTVKNNGLDEIDLCSLMNSILWTPFSDIRKYTSSLGKQEASNL